jgi:hypothetical protein
VRVSGEPLRGVEAEEPAATPPAFPFLEPVHADVAGSLARPVTHSPGFVHTAR